MLKFAAALLAAACDAYQVDVLPFEPARAEVAYEQLTRLNGRPTVGAVMARATARVDGCRITMGYAEPVLVLARELDACSRQHVEEHELEHVRIYREALAEAGDRVTRDALTAGPQAALLAFYEDVRGRHAAHDSDDEYARNGTACGGRIAALSRRRFH